VDDTTRSQYLARVERETATLGVTIPESISVQGQDFPLNAFVYDICSDHSVPDRYDVTLEEVKPLLRRERNDRLERLEEGDITEAQAEQLVNSIHELDRALEMLTEPTEDGTLQQEMERVEAEQTQRWRNFVSKIRDELGK